MVITVQTIMFDTSSKKMKAVLFSASHSVQIFFRMFSVLVLIFLFLHRCQSKHLYVKGLFTRFYTINKNFKTAFKKHHFFFSFCLRKNQSFKALC